MIPSVLPISPGGGRGSGVIDGRGVAGWGVGVAGTWVGVTDGWAALGTGVIVADPGVPLGVSELAA